MPADPHRTWADDPALTPWAGAATPPNHPVSSAPTTTPGVAQAGRRRADPVESPQTPQDLPSRGEVVEPETVDGTHGRAPDPSPAPRSAVVPGPWQLGPPAQVVAEQYQAARQDRLSFPVPPRAEGTADALSYQQLVRTRRDRPQEGWRGAVYTMTRGRMNPGLSPTEADRRQRIARMQTQLAGWHTVTVASMKGGIGKTTVSALLGLVLAEFRGDRVVALDANPDAGTLADRLLGQAVPYTVRDLLKNLDTIHSLTDVATYTSLAGRLQVLASEQDPAMSESFNRDEYIAVTEVLKRFYNIIITDSGTGLLHSAMHGALENTGTLVIAGAPTVDGGSRAAKTLDWLKEHGFEDLVANAVVVISLHQISDNIDRGAVVDHFQQRCRAVVEIPGDPHLATGGLIQLDQLRPRTRDAAISLGALVADAFHYSRNHLRPPENQRSVHPEAD